MWRNQIERIGRFGKQEEEGGRKRRGRCYLCSDSLLFVGVFDYHFLRKSLKVVDATCVYYVLPEVEEYVKRGRYRRRE